MKVVEDKQGEFCRPIVVNDWEVLGYFLRAVKSDIGTWGIAEQDDALRLRAGDAVIVRWPDGSESQETIASFPHRASVSDHGHRYDVHTEKLVIARDGKLVPIETVYLRPAEAHEVERVVDPDVAFLVGVKWP